MEQSKTYRGKMKPGVLCVIPARGGSKRIPNKNLRQLCGKPLISYAIEAALESKLSDRVAVSTDDPKIAGIADRYKVMTIGRPPEFALDTSPIDDALRHAVRTCREKDGFDADIVVSLQANVPIRKSGEIDEVIDRLTRSADASSVATGFLVDQRPEWMKTVDLKTGLVRPFMNVTELYRKQDLSDLYLLDGAIVAVRTPVLLAAEGVKLAHKYLGDKVYIIVHDIKYSVEIDEEKDFGLAEHYLSAKG